MIEYYVYRQDPPKTTRKMKPDGTAEVIGHANLVPLGSVFVSHPAKAMEEAKRKFGILRPVIEIPGNVSPV